MNKLLWTIAALAIGVGAVVTMTTEGHHTAALTVGIVADLVTGALALLTVYGRSV